MLAATKPTAIPANRPPAAPDHVLPGEIRGASRGPPMARPIGVGADIGRPDDHQQDDDLGEPVGWRRTQPDQRDRGRADVEHADGSGDRRAATVRAMATMAIPPAARRARFPAAPERGQAHGQRQRGEHHDRAGLEGRADTNAATRTPCRSRSARPWTREGRTPPIQTHPRASGTMTAAERIRVRRSPHRPVAGRSTVPRLLAQPERAPNRRSRRE